MATTQSPRPAGPDHDGEGRPPPRRRTALVVVGISLAAAAVVTVPFVARDLDHRPAPSGHHPTPGRSPSRAVGLPADPTPLRPAAPGRASRLVVTDVGDRWSLRRTPGAGGPSYAVVVRSQGTVSRVRVPATWRPVLERSPVSIGELTDGVLVSQGGRHADTWHVYVAWAGRISALRMRGPVPLGGGSLPAGSRVYRSWLGADGRPYTRIATARPDRYRVWTWLPSVASAWTPPTLVAHSLGTLCLDQSRATYATCRS